MSTPEEKILSRIDKALDRWDTDNEPIVLLGQEQWVALMWEISTRPDITLSGKGEVTYRTGEWNLQVSCTHMTTYFRITQPKNFN